MVCKCGHAESEHGKFGCLTLLGDGQDMDFCPCLKYEEDSLDKVKVKVEMSEEIKNILDSIIKNGFNYLPDNEQPKDIDQVLEFLLKNTLNRYLKFETRGLLYNYQVKWM
jgi:hypothetical protein